MIDLDPRLNAFRPDLADQNLKGRVNAPCFVKGVEAQICVPVAKLHRAPGLNNGVDTELLYGAKVHIFNDENGFCWVQADEDSYVGYLESRSLKKGFTPPTHIVVAPRTFLYPGPDLKFPALCALSMGSRLTIIDEAETRGSRYGILASGEAVFLNHVTPNDALQKDYVHVAETLLRTPYLWGGASAFGIDCSGLVQLSFAMTGKTVLRDTDMQERSIGQALHENEPLKRGDLIFWKGHVAIMLDDQHIIHANGASMDVKIEPLQETIERIAKLYARPTSFRRPL